MKNVGGRKMNLVDTVVENLIAISDGATLCSGQGCFICIFFCVISLSLSWLSNGGIVSMVNLIMI